MSEHIVETCPIDDCFVTELPRVEHIAECVRLTFIAPERSSHSDSRLLIVKAKLIVPITALIPMGRAVLAAASPEEAVSVYRGLDVRAH